MNRQICYSVSALLLIPPRQNFRICAPKDKKLPPKAAKKFCMVFSPIPPPQPEDFVPPPKARKTPPPKKIFETPPSRSEPRSCMHIRRIFLNELNNLKTFCLFDQCELGSGRHFQSCSSSVPIFHDSLCEIAAAATLAVSSPSPSPPPSVKSESYGSRSCRLQ